MRNGQEMTPSNNAYTNGRQVMLQLNLMHRDMSRAVELLKHPNAQETAALLHELEGRNLHGGTYCSGRKDMVTG